MSLTVTLARVKEKCGLAGTEHDASVTALIAEMLPVIEYQVDPVYLSDTSNAGLQATLTLAATELVCGEYLEQLMRQSGLESEITLGDIHVTHATLPPYARLKTAGRRRLAPFVKQSIGNSGGSVLAGGNRSPAETGESNP